MRIRELLEHIEDRNNNGINDKLEYDLADDLLFFLNHNDDVYRRHVFPAIIAYKNHRIKNKNADHSLFSGAVNKGYEIYAKRFPRRELPETLPKEICEKICDSLSTEADDSKG